MTSTALVSPRLYGIFAASVLALFAASLFVGAGSGTAALLLPSRLPRSLAALLAGAGLAIAGLVMQTIARNRFVEPSTVGATQSAGLGILAAAVFLPEASIVLKMAAATLTALAGTALFLVLARRLPPTQPLLLPLFGIVYSSVVGAALTFLAWQADLLQFVEIWMNGEFSGVVRGRYELLFAAALMVALAWWAADRLTVAALGPAVATGLGLDLAATRRLGVVIVAVVSALTVVVVGALPFVGLVVPAMVSRLVGDNLRASLPLVALGGAGLVLAADIAGRLVRYPYEIPVGTILGVVGALVFLWLLWRGQHG